MLDRPSVHAPQIVGRYALHGEIASGGMATVHVGRLLGSVGFSRTVAIKRLHPHLAKDPEFVSMLLDEARLAARIVHPNVVSVLDVVASQGELLIVMNYVQGESLWRLLRGIRAERKRVPLDVAVKVMIDTLNGLHAAHEATNERGEPLGIVHRDVSPHNVLVGVDGTARVIDFGVAKAAGRIQSTRDGQLKGKLAYMAPEQVRMQTVTRRTDIYSASVVMWEILSGRRLFRTQGAAVVYEILEAKIPAPSQLAPNIPKKIDEIVMRGLALNPVDRFTSAQEMAELLGKTVPSPTAREMGVWVEQTAKDALKQRALRVAEVESGSYMTRLPASSAIELAKEEASAKDIADDFLEDLDGAPAEAPRPSKAAAEQEEENSAPGASQPSEPSHVSTFRGPGPAPAEEARAQAASVPDGDPQPVNMARTLRISDGGSAEISSTASLPIGPPQSARVSRPDGSDVVVGPAIRSAPEVVASQDASGAFQTTDSVVLPMRTPSRAWVWVAGIGLSAVVLGAGTWLAVRGLSGGDEAAAPAQSSDVADLVNSAPTEPDQLPLEVLPPETAPPAVASDTPSASAEPSATAPPTPTKHGSWKRPPKSTGTKKPPPLSTWPGGTKPPPPKDYGF